MRPPAACHHPTRRRVLKHGLRVFGAALPLASNAQSALSRLRGSTVRFTVQTGIRVDAVKSPYLGMKGAQRALFDKIEHIGLEHIGRALPGMMFHNQPIEAGLAELSNAINGVLLRSGRRSAADARKPTPAPSLTLTPGTLSR